MADFRLHFTWHNLASLSKAPESVFAPENPFPKICLGRFLASAANNNTHLLPCPNGGGESRKHRYESWRSHHEQSRRFRGEKQRSDGPRCRATARSKHPTARGTGGGARQRQNQCEACGRATWSTKPK